jgi:N-acyl-D-amino-acid deacylase
MLDSQPRLAAWRRPSAAALAAIVLPLLTLHSVVAASATTLIVHAEVLDGGGGPARDVAVRLDGDRIVEIGKLRPRPGEIVVDAQGKTLAPGFIDTHSHAGGDIFEHPDALAAVSQGITTVVVGQDGDSNFPLASFYARLEKAPPTINVASYTGHGTLREMVMGDEFRRTATAAEVEAMKRLLDVDMEAGSLGLSTGLEYDPGIYSSRGELIDLARVSAAHGGRYISHIRSEDRKFWEAIDEILAIGREAKLPVQISHIKLAMKTLWGQAPRLLAELDAARKEGIDVSADIYPYLYWHSTLTVLFPERNFEDLPTAELVLDQVTPADGLLLDNYKPEPSYAGKTVAEIAVLRNQPPAQTLIELIRVAEAARAKGEEDVESVIGTGMVEPDVRALLAWPETNICTDGALDGGHPRGFGTYPRVLGRYVREDHLLPLPKAIRRMTSLAAEHVGLEGRGRIEPGAYADLVLFDPGTVLDRATTKDPHAVSVGIATVWVNGAVVYDAGAVTAARPGRVLRRAGAVAGAAPAGR